MKTGTIINRYRKKRMKLNEKLTAKIGTIINRCRKKHMKIDEKLTAKMVILYQKHEDSLDKLRCEYAQELNKEG